MRTARRLGTVAATLAEGVVADGPDAVVWVDIPHGRVHRTTLDGATRTVAELPEPVGCVARDRTGDLVVATPTGLRVVDAAAGHPYVARLPEVTRGVRMNDGAVDPDGRLVAGTMADDATPCAGTLWSFDGVAVRALRRGVTISNGLAWSADGATMYYVDTATRRIDAHPYHADGQLGPRRTVVDVPRDLGDPDGMTIDADGLLWVALWGGGGVVTVDPVDGSIRRRVDVPRRNTTSCALIGHGSQAAVVVTAAETDPGAGDGGLFVAPVVADPAPLPTLRVAGASAVAVRGTAAASR